MSRIRCLSLGLLVGSAAWLATENAHADAQFELGFRSGYGIPWGKASDAPGDGMSEGIVGQIPLWLDVGARLGGHVFVGGYVAYGFGFLSKRISDVCDAAKAAAGPDIDLSCSAHDTRLGAEVLYHFAAPGTDLDPWLGGGIGYEWMGTTTSASSGSQSVSIGVEAHGFEFLNLQLGLDVPVSDKFALGPFVGFTLAQYATLSGSCSGDCTGTTSNSVGIENKALHGWVFLGVRGDVAF